VKERSNSKPVLAFPCPRKLIHQQTENWRTFPLLPAVSNFSRGATLKFEEFCLICCKDWCKFSSFEHFSLWKPEGRETVKRNAETGGIFTFCSFEHSENLKEEKLWGATRKLEESCPFFCKDWSDSFSFDHFNVWRPGEETLRCNAETGAILSVFCKDWCKICFFEHFNVWRPDTDSRFGWKWRLNAEV